MKAAQHTTYNKKNITLNITEIAKPSITDKEVLVKVTAAGVNPLDNMISRGEVKMIVPYKLPQTAGNEVVGIIEETGTQVKNLKVGDRVFGRLPLDHIGAFAEYVAVDSQALAKVPDYLSDEEAAAVVKRIFDLCIAGKGPMQIAKILTADKVLTVKAYYAKRDGKTMPDNLYR